MRDAASSNPYAMADRDRAARDNDEELAVVEEMRAASADPVMDEET